MTEVSTAGRAVLLGSSADLSGVMDSGAVGDPSTPEFQFEARRARLDWRLLHAVDVDRLMRENDIDTLETTLVRPRASPDARFAFSASTTTFPPSRPPPLTPTPTPPHHPHPSAGDRGVRRHHR